MSHQNSPNIKLWSCNDLCRTRHLEAHKLYHVSCAIQSRWSHVFVQLEHLRSEHVPGWQPHVGLVHHYQQRLWPYLGGRNIGAAIVIWFQAVAPGVFWVDSFCMFLLQIADALKNLNYLSYLKAEVVHQDLFESSTNSSQIIFNQLQHKRPKNDQSSLQGTLVSRDIDTSSQEPIFGRVKSLRQDRLSCFFGCAMKHCFDLPWFNASRFPKCFVKRILLICAILIGVLWDAVAGTEKFQNLRAPLDLPPSRPVGNITLNVQSSCVEICAKSISCSPNMTGSSAELQVGLTSTMKKRI